MSFVVRINSLVSIVRGREAVGWAASSTNTASTHDSRTGNSLAGGSRIWVCERRHEMAAPDRRSVDTAHDRARNPVRRRLGCSCSLSPKRGGAKAKESQQNGDAEKALVFKGRDFSHAVGAFLAVQLYRLRKNVVAVAFGISVGL